ncbi:MAG: hypothetical protein M0R17_04730 [Candidatus Omnitrophica bacterium]|jgi:hypothetical protein|nr:hypothetical protein [Candidatus Omnitrophota bacterium]
MRKILNNIDKLIKFAKNVSTIDEKLIETWHIVRFKKKLKKIKSKLEYLYKTSVTWTVEDFETQASDLEGFYNKENIYDRSKFRYTLELMIIEHDANIGISWDTIVMYLNAYCKHE